MHKYTIAALIVLLLAGCGGEAATLSPVPPPTTAPNSPATVSPTLVGPSPTKVGDTPTLTLRPTRTARPTKAPTFTRVPTRTLQPTRTEDPNALATSTRRPTGTPTITGTPSPLPSTYPPTPTLDARVCTNDALNWHDEILDLDAETRKLAQVVSRVTPTETGGPSFIVDLDAWEALMVRARGIVTPRSYEAADKHWKKVMYLWAMVEQPLYKDGSMQEWNAAHQEILAVIHVYLNVHGRCP